MSLAKQIGKKKKKEADEVKAICMELVRVVYFAGQAIEDIEKGVAKPEDIAEVKQVINQLLEDFGVYSKEVKNEETGG